MPSFLSFLEDTDEECYNFINSRTAADDDPQMIAALITYLDQEKFRNNLEKLSSAGQITSTFVFGGSTWKSSHGVGKWCR